MIKKLTTPIVILVIIFLVLSFISSIKHPKQKPLKALPQEKFPQALYVELSEINHDKFKDRLFVDEPEVRTRPFYLRDEKLMLNKELIQSMKDKGDINKYRLFVDKMGLDIQKEAKLFLVYSRLYDGVGRDSLIVDYFILSSFPAKITIPSFDWASGKVHLTLDDSITNTLNIRIIPSETLLINKMGHEEIEISYAGTKFTVSADQEKPLSKESMKLGITQEFIEPVPKGEITEKDVKMGIFDYGAIEFLTEVKANNRGLCEVKIE